MLALLWQEAKLPATLENKTLQNIQPFHSQKVVSPSKAGFHEGLHDIPKWVLSDLAALNDLRNGVAHWFFPLQNRRRKPDWKGKSVFTRVGLDHFLEDMDKLSDFFHNQFWAGSPEDIMGRPDATKPSGRNAGL